MNTRRNAGGEIGGADVGVNQVPPQTRATRMEMLVNPTGLTDGEVRTTLVQMAQAITLQAQAMISLAEQQGVPNKNKLRDFTRMNPLIYTGSQIVENLKEERREAMLHGSMDFSRLMVCVQQVEENRKRKRTRAQNRSRKDEKIFSIKSSTKIRDKPRFNKGLSHQGESSSFKGRYDRDSKPTVKRYIVVCEKERWKSQKVYRLLVDQQSHYQE